MSSKYKFRDHEKLYFITYTVINWLDVFIRNEYKKIMLDSWKYCVENKGMELFGWCIMTSHVHMIIGSHGDPMDAIMHDMKIHTSKELRKEISDNTSESRKEWLPPMMKGHNKNFQFWQEGNHPIELFDLKIAHQKLDYIHRNPVVSGIVENPEDYLYSSARDYYGKKGLIELTLLDPVLY